MKTKKTRIEFEYEGKQYTLEYTADSLRTLQARGFDVSTADSRLLTLGEELFCGAFIANHDDVDEETRKEIYRELCDALDNPEALTKEEQKATKGKIEAIVVQMFREACSELRSHRGNVKWRIA